MYNSRPVLRGLKGFLLHKALVNKRTFLRYLFIMLGLIPINIILMYILYSLGVSSGGSENLFTYGLAIGSIILLFLSLNATTDKTMKLNFEFPINRKIYTLGNFIFISCSTILFMLVTALTGILELIILNISFDILGKIHVANNITYENFIAGFFVSVSYIVFILVLAYCFGCFFFRNRLLTSLFLLLLSLVFVFPQGRSFMFEVLRFFVFETSVLVLCIKLWIGAGLATLIGHLPVRKLEVN